MEGFQGLFLESLADELLLWVFILAILKFLPRLWEAYGGQRDETYFATQQDGSLTPEQLQSLYFVIFALTWGLFGAVVMFVLAAASAFLSLAPSLRIMLMRLDIILAYFVAGRWVCKKILLPRLAKNARVVLSGSFVPAAILLHFCWLLVLPCFWELAGNAPEAEQVKLRYRRSVWSSFK